MRMIFDLYNVDELSRNVIAPLPGMSIRMDADWQSFRRYRPDFVAATEYDSWEREYYNPVASVPWAGFITADNALVLQDNLTLVGDHALIGRAFMYPPEVFPYPKEDMVITPLESGQWQLECPDHVRHLGGVTLSLVVDGWRIYGHWLVDMLPKLERARRSGFHIDQYLLPAPSQPWQLAMLETVGLAHDQCVFVDLSKAAVRCDRLIIPTYDRFNSEVRPEFIRIHERLRQHYAADITPEKADRNLFVARAEGVRMLVNRTVVEKLAVDMGFEIVRPETMTLVEQIRLFASARAIMGECGSALNNAVFSFPGTHVASIQNAEHPDHLQAQIAYLKGQNIFYALGENAGPLGAFHVPIAHVRAVADRVLHRSARRDIKSDARSASRNHAPDTTFHGEDRDPTRPLFFMHIPKAAGTALRGALRSALNPRVFVDAFDGCLSGTGSLATTATKPDVILNATDLPAADLVAAHMGAGTAIAHYPDAQRITFLRVPEVRILSHWLYWRAIGDEHLIYPEDKIKIPLARKSLEAFLNDERLAFELDNVATRMLLWPDDRIAPDRWISIGDDALLRAAMTRLSDFAYADVIENRDFKDNLSRWLNVTVQLDRQNETTFTPEHLSGMLKDELTSSVFEKLSNLTRLDRKIWSHVAQLRMSAEESEDLRSSTLMLATLRHHSLFSNQKFSHRP